MSTKLYVGGLSWGTNDSTLRQEFEAFGAVNEVIIITDRDTGRSRGFGFVTFADQDSAQAAISEMNGKELDGRSITVSIAEERSRNDRSGGGFGRDSGKNRGNKNSRNRW